MKQLALFLGILFLITGSACKKKNLKYVIKGTVYDASYNAPLAGATVIISTTSTNNTTLTQKATLTTDASGNYSYELDREKLKSVVITVSKTNYFGEETTTTLDHLSIENDNTFNYSIYAKSWVRLHFVSNGTKTVKYFRTAGKNGCEECCPGGEMLLSSAVDESVYCINNGNTTYSIFYDVQGTTDNGTLSATTVPFDTTEILISY